VLQAEELMHPSNSFLELRLYTFNKQRHSTVVKPILAK
jgi:hypothetical protein